MSKDSNDGPKLVSRQQAAEILGVHPDSIRRMARDKGLLREVFIGGHSRYRYEDVMRLLEQGDGEGTRDNVGEADPAEEALTDAERNPSLAGPPTPDA